MEACRRDPSFGHGFPWRLASLPTWPDRLGPVPVSLSLSLIPQRFPCTWRAAVPSLSPVGERIHLMAVLQILQVFELAFPGAKAEAD